VTLSASAFKVRGSNIGPAPARNLAAAVCTRSCRSVLACGSIMRRAPTTWVFMLACYAALPASHVGLY
jgi:hypothetical protein